jgi:hypothetical protein
MSATSSLSDAGRPTSLGAATASAGWRRGLAREVARLADLPRCRSWVPDVTRACVSLLTGPLLGAALATLVEPGGPGSTQDRQPGAQRDAGPEREPLPPGRDAPRAGRAPRPRAPWPPDEELSGVRRTPRPTAPAGTPTHRAAACPTAVDTGADGRAGLRAVPTTVGSPVRVARPAALGVPLLDHSRAAFPAALTRRASRRLDGSPRGMPSPPTHRSPPPDPVPAVAGGLPTQWALPLGGTVAPAALLLDLSARPRTPQQTSTTADRARPAAGGPVRHAPSAGGVAPDMAEDPVTGLAIGWLDLSAASTSGAAHSLPWPDLPPAGRRRPSPTAPPVVAGTTTVDGMPPIAGTATNGIGTAPHPAPPPMLRQRADVADGDDPTIAGHAMSPSDIDVAEREEDLFVLTERVGRMLAHEARRHGIDV